MLLTCGVNGIDVLHVTQNIFVLCMLGIMVPFNVAVGLYWRSLL